MRVVLIVALLTLVPPAAGSPDLTHGPFVGHVTSDSVTIWARGSETGSFDLRAAPSGSGDWAVTTATALVRDDLCLTLVMEGLEPLTRYDYEVYASDAGPGTGLMSTFTTAPPDHAAARIRIAFGSCANGSAGALAVWERIGLVAPDAVVLLGDTPYIDTTDLAVQRRRYREFAALPVLREVLGRTSWYGTWDDHDFGQNDTDGNLPGKRHARRAFVEYHANPTYGHGKVGIYTSFRRGPVEVFLLDTRWFAATGPSPTSDRHPTLLGPVQWDWLLRGLSNSDATFKVLASGMIWNRAVRPLKTDMWATYGHERDALFRSIGDAGITGVVLVGGDIHRSRVVRHAVADLAGYELTELITSPMHGGIIDAANAPHPGLVWDAGAPNAFLVLTVDSTVSPATLTATFTNAAGDLLHVESLDETRLVAP